MKPGLQLHETSLLFVWRVFVIVETVQSKTHWFNNPTWVDQTYPLLH